MKEKKKIGSSHALGATGFEPAPQPPPVQKLRPHTTRPRNHCTYCFLKLIFLKYFSLPFTLFKPCGAVFIMNSKIHNFEEKYLK